MLGEAFLCSFSFYLFLFLFFFFFGGCCFKRSRHALYETRNVGHAFSTVLLFFVFVFFFNKTRTPMHRCADQKKIEFTSSKKTSSV